MKTRRPIQEFLKQHRDLWDKPDTPSHVRREFEKVIVCGTPSLGKAIYRSSQGKLEVCFSCKSKACSSCGQVVAQNWAEKMKCQLPDIPYASVMLTIPSSLWPIFKSNPNLLNSLAGIGAGALCDWAIQKYGAEVPIIAVLHTFGGDLKFNPHLHILVGRTGLSRSGNQIIEGIRFYSDQVRMAWRHNLIDHLRDVHQVGLLLSNIPNSTITELLDYQYDKWWKVGVENTSNCREYVRYISRYLRRPPIANKNVLSLESDRICFLAKDTKGKAKTQKEISPQRFMGLLISQVRDRYANSIYYFGLLAPRTKAQKWAIFRAFLGYPPAKKFTPVGWRARRIQHFGADPLIDDSGEIMRWERNVIPPPA